MIKTNVNEHNEETNRQTIQLTNTHMQQKRVIGTTKDSREGTTEGWPNRMTFEEFKKISPTSEEWIYRNVYELRGEQISIQNQRIGMAKLAKILRATFKLSASHGFGAMSLRQLSTESGISMGGLYSYIESKDELANMIGHAFSVISTEVIDRALEDIEGIRNKVIAAICVHLFLSEQLQPWFYFVFMESKSLSKAQKEIAKQAELQYELRISSLIEEGIEQKTFQPVDIDLTASTAMALLQDWHLKKWKHRARKINVDQYADYVVNLILMKLDNG